MVFERIRGVGALCRDRAGAADLLRFSPEPLDGGSRYGNVSTGGEEVAGLTGGERRPGNEVNRGLM